VSGYTFKVPLGNEGQDYVTTATPFVKEKGRYAYHSTPDAVIRYSTDPSLSPENLSGSPVQ